MAAGLSNREIAARLVVSLGTIKTHVHHICGKMGVTNRTQAVVQARDLERYYKIIPPIYPPVDALWC